MLTEHHKLQVRLIMTVVVFFYPWRRRHKRMSCTVDVSCSQSLHSHAGAVEPHHRVSACPPNPEQASAVNQHVSSC